MQIIMKWVKLHQYIGMRKYFWFLVTFLKFLDTITRAMYAFERFEDPISVTEITVTLPTRFLSVCKLFYLYHDRRRVEYFYKTIENEFWGFHICSPEKQSNIKRRFMFVNIILIVTFTSGLTVLITMIIFPLVEPPEGKRPLPSINWTPFDTNPSPIYEIMYVIVFCVLVMTIIGNAFYDYTLVYAVQHLRVQFTLLKELLKNITDGILPECSDFKKFNDEYFQRIVAERLKICIQHHVKLLKFGKNLEIFTSKIMVIQFTMSYVTLVVTGYVLNVSHINISQVVALSVLTGVYLVELLIYCAQGTDLNQQSLSVFEAIIESEWHLLKAPNKRALTLFLLNSERGITLKAGGTTSVDNELLVTFLKSVFSAITLLNSILEEKK